MDNLFITQHFDWDPPPARWARLANGFLRRLGFGSQLRSPFQGEMTSIEQRINLFHLLSQVLAFNVPGDVVEIGTHAGVTATLLMTVMQQYAPERRLHLFDAFLNPTEASVIDNFQRLQLPSPEFHRGWLHETLPEHLPEQVAFFQLDLGPGRSPDLMADDISAALEEIYPHMSPGAIGVLQDYCDPTPYQQPGWHFPDLILSLRNWNQYPQVKRACDDFFADKPESMHSLYAGCYAHGYFRKLA